MAVIADIFVAEPADAMGYVRADLAQDRAATAAFTPKSFKGLTDLDFSILWAILEATDYDIDLHEMDSVPLAGLPDGSMMYRFPDRYVALLAAMDAKTQTRAAAEWADTEELDCHPSDLHPVLRDLQQLAASARQKNHCLFFYAPPF